ncbi:TonB-dependent receptor [uncultured Paludibaculum sp.]|uniref:TonB-dependent receptor n=1 Tax=uncultured Paludibaculum sp. TaxID=1765020 RepID=UPI002AAC2CDD|nr:TonB-dependent receptor [uncultured Paludibaculum sp.]
MGNAGTIIGTIQDPSNEVVAGARVSIANPLTGYRREVLTDATGGFRFTNIPPNHYHLNVVAPGFAKLDHDVIVRTAVPINLALALKLESSTSSVTVEADSTDVLETVPFAHSDVDHTSLTKLPSGSPGSGLSDAITLSAPGVVADSNGFFHPLGDHAQTSFSIDGQPISDQQSKQFSTQIPVNAIQSMELITGAPSAEFGDKTSLVVNAVTRSGLDQNGHGSVRLQYGSFGTISEDANLSLGTSKFGNFLAFNTLRSGRFLDTPEFQPMHAVGSNGTLFDRIDYKPTARDSFHVNLFAARNWFQTPVTYDQLNQDQRQRVETFNISGGYQRTIGTSVLLTLTPFVRRDHLNYYPSADAFADTPATVQQERYLTNYGFRGDVAYVKGRHNLKFGTQITQTRLDEQFHLGITNSDFNPVCLSSSGDPLGLPGVTDPAACAASGAVANPDVLTSLIPIDLTRGGTPLFYKNRGKINQYAFYGQDSITLGQFSVNLGLRIDSYNGLSAATGVQPRIGLSYHSKATGTVFRASFSRTFETPYNENLLLSSATGAGGLASNVFGAYGQEPLRPGNRNQYNAGLQQAIGRWIVIDADYFWKYTRNAYDFDTLFNTPIQFPISWRRSAIDGVSVKVSTINIHGFQAYSNLGHTRARFFGPSNGGLIFNSPLSTGVFRIDHDQAFQQTTNLRYQKRKDAPWAAFTWRYDSGMVSGAVPDLESALALTGAEQAAIGFHCGGVYASVSNPISACASSYGATRLVIPAAGTASDDHNPPRIAPRHLFDVSTGTDNLFHREKLRTSLRFTVLNLTNQASLYNFLSTFSGTHFVAPRTYQAELGFNF